MHALMEMSDDARKTPKGDVPERKCPICWAFDGEADSPLVRFDDPAAADDYVRRQNLHQGRDRWTRLDTLRMLPGRADGTPALLPDGGGISIAGFLHVDCASALEIAGALTHAAAGRRRIAGLAIATPVDGDVDLEIQSADEDELREWRFQARDARLLAARLATLAVSCLPVVTGDPS